MSSTGDFSGINLEKDPSDKNIFEPLTSGTPKTLLKIDFIAKVFNGVFGDIDAPDWGWCPL